MASIAGQLTSMCQILQRLNLNWSTCAETLIQTRNYAARKSTRERKLKILRALKAKKLAREAQQQRTDALGGKKFILKKSKNIKIPEYIEHKEYLLKPVPNDDVYLTSHHQWKIYPFEEAVLSHREFCHPTIMDIPNSYLSLFLELNMQSMKKTKPLGKFTRIVDIPHLFDLNEKRTVATFCKTDKEIEEAKNAGSTAVFGPPDIKEIAKGTISLNDYQVIVAHPSILPELTNIKGYMRKLFPTTKNGTLSENLTQAIRKQLHGINYTVTPYPNYLEYGYSSILIGQLDMNIDKLKDNCIAVLKDVYQKRPKKSGPFILRLRLACADSSEKFKLNLNEFISEDDLNKPMSQKILHEAKEEEEEEEEEEERDNDEEDNSAVIPNV